MADVSGDRFSDHRAVVFDLSVRRDSASEAVEG
jgi:hypothetical protein